jgi:hypothetical protein
MKRKLSMMAILGIIMMAYASFSFGAVSPEEAAKLGTTLTPFGAEMAGNKEGTIPPYTGGLTTPPANYKGGSGMRPDPFAGEKPLFSISAQNMSQYADKLTEGTKVLMKKFPTFRTDVYKTHRTVAYPEYVMKHTARNAVKATTANGGLSVKDARAGIPFPIPKDGYEVMWNHLLRYQGRAWESKTISAIVDSSGELIDTSFGVMWQEFPYYDEDPTLSDAAIYWKFRWHYLGPPRKAGEVGQLTDPINMYERGRIAYLYLVGQRRVKLAPEVSFDTPTTDTSGNDTYDENWLFNGSMERYNFKLIGKKECYVPYNCYRAVYETKKEQLFGPRHINPDVIRWELHRVWVVQATLKPGKRHIYAKRVLYIDEDSWTALAGELYDAHGNFFKIDNVYVTQNYDFMAPCTATWSHYNMINDVYAVQFLPGEIGYVRQTKVRPEREWAVETMGGKGIR